MTSIIDTYHQRCILSHLPYDAKVNTVPMEDDSCDITGLSFSQTKGVDTACELYSGCRVLCEVRAKTEETVEQ